MSTKIAMDNSCTLIGPLPDPIFFLIGLFLKVCFGTLIRLLSINMFSTTFLRFCLSLRFHVLPLSTTISSCPDEEKEESPRASLSLDRAAPDFSSLWAGFTVFSARATTPNAWVEAPRSTWPPSWSKS